MKDYPEVEMMLKKVIDIEFEKVIKEILDEIAPSEYSKYLKENPKSDLTFWGFQRMIIKQKSGGLIE